MRGVSKQDLPEKRCLVCQRPFHWRKRWQRVWAEVKYCSEGCRKNRAVKAIAANVKENPS